MAEANTMTRSGGALRLLILFLALLMLVLVVFTVWPLGEAAPAWLNALQGSVRIASSALSPFILVGLLGGLIGIAELVSTFRTYPREALLTRWAWVLVFANFFAAMAALLILRATAPQLDLMLQIVAVGIGFQGIIRTRFVLARQVGAKGESEVAVNLGWLYDQFSNLARHQIDLELMNNRRTAVTRLIDSYPTLADLYDIALYTITARQTLSPEEENDRLAELERMIDPKAPEHFAKTAVALMILEDGGQAYVNLLLNQAGTGSAPEIALPANHDALVRDLVARYDLAQLVSLADRLTDNEDVRNYIRLAAAPDPTIGSADQKATIAHFMVQEIGADTVRRSLEQNG